MGIGQPGVEGPHWDLDSKGNENGPKSDGSQRQVVGKRRSGRYFGDVPGAGDDVDAD